MTNTPQNGGEIAKLFRDWLALREEDHRPGKDEDENDQLDDKTIAVERAILDREPITAEDKRAQLAVLAYYAVHQAPYASYEALERHYQRLIVDGLSPAAGERERKWSDKRLQNAKERLAELGAGDPAEPDGRPIDRHEKFVAEALLLRALHTYREARERAKDVKVDLAIAPEPSLSYAALSDRYDELMQGFVPERPDTANGVVAVLDLAAQIVAHVHRGPFVEESAISSDEREMSYALQLIDGARWWANARDIAEFADEVRGRKGMHPPPDARTRQALRALVDKWDTEAGRDGAA